MADNFNFVQVQDLYLAGSGVGATDTTIILKSFKYVDDTNVVMADFGTIGFMTLDPNTSREENISFTGITQNGDGTATLTGVTRGLKNKAPYDADTTLRKSHSGSSVAVVSNSAPFYNKMTGKDNDETVTGVWTFANNTFYLGDDANTDKEFRFLTDNANNPGFKFNATENQLEFRRRGETSYTQIPLSLRGTYADYASLPTDASNGDIAITDDDHKLYVYDSGTTTWVLSGGSSGAGTVYKTVKYGTEADGDDNKTFTLTAGSWPDEKFLLVYKNGVLMENNASGDYEIVDSNTIEFNYEVEDTDKIVMIVVSVDLYNPDWGLVNASIVPDTDNAYDIGSSSKQFKDIYLEGDLIKDGVAATSTPTANAIPIADGSGKLDSNWVSLDVYGDGSDGDVTISTNTNLTRDMYYNNLIVNSGVILNPNGYRIFVKNILTNNGTIARNGNNGSNGSTSETGYIGSGAGGGGGGAGSSGGIVLIIAKNIINNGAIQSNGGNGGNGSAGRDAGINDSGTTQVGRAGGNGGTALSAGSIPGGVAGGNGQQGAGGVSSSGTTGSNGSQSTNDTTQVNSIGTLTGEVSSKSGDGGASGGSTGYVGGVGADGGTPSTATAPMVKPWFMDNFVELFFFTPSSNDPVWYTSSVRSNGGNGGASGGNTNASNNENNGGGGGGAGGTGGSGGVLIIVSKSLENNGDIEAKGGQGGSGGAGGAGLTVSGYLPGQAGEAGEDGNLGADGTVYLISC